VESRGTARAVTVVLGVIALAVAVFVVQSRMRRSQRLDAEEQAARLQSEVQKLRAANEEARRRLEQYGLPRDASVLERDAGRPEPRSLEDLRSGRPARL
jgi:hypothetical protein